MAIEMVPHDSPTNVIPFPHRMALDHDISYDEFEVDGGSDTNRRADFRKPVELGNIWHLVATMAKIRLLGQRSEAGEAYCLHLSDKGDMFLIQVTERGSAPPPDEAKFATWMTMNCCVEGISRRLKETGAFHSA